MYNTQPPHQHSRGHYICQKRRHGERTSGSRLENGLGRWVQHSGGNERMTSRSDIT